MVPASSSTRASVRALGLSEFFDPGFGASLGLGEFFDLSLGASLGLSQICNRRFQAGGGGFVRLTEAAKVLLRGGVLGFFKHCAECLSEALGPFLAEDCAELLVDHQRVHKGHHNDSSPEL
jgi:hypothetical protein